MSTSERQLPQARLRLILPRERMPDHAPLSGVDHPEVAQPLPNRGGNMPREDQDDALAVADAADPAALEAGLAANVGDLLQERPRDLALEYTRTAALDAHDEGVAVPHRNKDDRDQNCRHKQNLD